MNKVKRDNIFEIFKNQQPQPKTELIYDTVFELLIAVILSAQATDVSVNKVTKILFKKCKTADDFLKLGESKLVKIIKSIGLFKTKASNIIKTCNLLKDNHGGEVPESRELLEKLPGVGRKTANVILNTYFRWDTIAVDTHVFRVSNRTRIAVGDNVGIVERKLNKLVSKQYKQNAHHWLILHGRYICKARKPLCEICPLEHLCEFKDKTVNSKNAN
ncbi:MAG: endonuclease III [Betaproteobacteria bacterium TMED82]|nr:MAG: endonuclease III [Betaproteobacteria bacterium TMED82]